MPVSVFKSVAADFGGVEPNIGKLQTEINADPGISAVCLYINTYGDTVEIVFDTSLTSGDETALDAVIAAHDPTPVVQYAQNMPISLNQSSTRNNTYTKIGQVVFPGGSEMRIKGNGYKEGTATSYSVKIYDITHNTTLVEQTFTNTADDVIIDLGVCDNVPADASVIRAFAKRNGGASSERAFVTSLFIYYN